MSVYEIYGQTNKGSEYEINEDHILLGRFVKNKGEQALQFQCEDEFIRDYGLLLAVADGIAATIEDKTADKTESAANSTTGGAAASQQALSILERRFYAAPKAVAAYESLIDATEQANQALLEIHTLRPDWSHMACTLAGVCLLSHGFYLFHCGDSRIYRYRHGVLKPLSRDDTITQAALVSGQLSLEQAQKEAERHRLTNYLGNPYFSCHIELAQTLQDNDILLIATDGFYDGISNGSGDNSGHNSANNDGDETIENILREHQGSLTQLGQHLTQLMLDTDSTDNFSFILLRQSSDTHI